MNIEEQKYLEQYNSDKFKKPSVTVDLLIFTVVDSKLKILLAKRNDHPYKDKLALPGTFVDVEESANETVKRILAKKLGISGNIYFEQLYTWTDVNRDPRMRIISISYYALLPLAELNSLLKDKSTLIELVDVDCIGDMELAFDHAEMIEYGRKRLQSKAEYSPIAFQLLDETFTLPELQNVTETLQGKKLYKTNFRNKIADLVEDTGQMISGVAHRPSKVYRRKK